MRLLDYTDGVSAVSDLLPGDLHIWHIDLTIPRDAASLSPDEQARAARLFTAQLRQRFTAARASLRQLLSLYTDISPEKLIFHYGEQGKPSLQGDPLQFNLSHAEDVALIAIARHPVGIDIEREQPLTDMMQVAAIAFSPAEQSALNATPPEGQTDVFYRIWTRKEAYMKGRGEGFKLAKTFTVPVTSPNLPILVDGWRLRDIPVQSGFAAAVAEKL